MYNLKNLVYTAITVYFVYVVVYQFILEILIGLPIDLYKEFKKK